MNFIMHPTENTQKFIMLTREPCLSVDQNADLSPVGKALADGKIGGGQNSNAVRDAARDTARDAISDRASDRR